MLIGKLVALRPLRELHLFFADDGASSTVTIITLTVRDSNQRE